MKEEVTKIKINHGGSKVSIEVAWDADVYKMYEAFEGIMLAVGFSQKSIDTVFEVEKQN